MGMLAILLLAALVLSVQVADADRQSGEHLRRAAEQRMLVEQVKDAAASAMAGDGRALAELRQLRDRADTLVGEILRGAPQAQLAPIPRTSAEQAREMENAWLALREPVDEVLAVADQVAQAHLALDVIAEMAPRLAAISDQTLAALGADGGNPDQLTSASRLAFLAQGLMTTRSGILAGGGTPGAVSAGLDQLTRDLETLGGLQQNLTSDEAIKAPGLVMARSRLGEIAVLLAVVDEYLPHLAEGRSALVTLADAGGRIDAAAAGAGEASALFMDHLLGDPGRWRIGPLKLGPSVIIVLLLAAVLTLLALGLALRGARRRRAAELSTQREFEDNALHRLAEDIAALEEDDFGLRVRVPGGRIGRVAEAVNHLMNSLKGRQRAMDESCGQVAAEAERISETLERLRKACGRQSVLAVSTGGRLNSIKTDLEAMTANAREAANTADKLALDRPANPGLSLVTDNFGAEPPASEADSLAICLADLSRRIANVAERQVDEALNVGQILEVLSQGATDAVVETEHLAQSIIKLESVARRAERMASGRKLP